ncbi:trypsin-like serine protease [Bacillus cereus]|nr:trypsin-like serine protease [Bacillus cereus]
METNWPIPKDILVSIHNRKSRSVINKDTRQRIKDTTQSPYQSIIFLQFRVILNDTGLDIGTPSCSGAIIDDSTILTAVHCVYSTTTKSFHFEITAHPDYDEGKEPYGHSPEATNKALQFNPIMQYLNTCPMDKTTQL